MNSGKREAKPFLLKAGFAIVLSLAGFFASRHWPRRGILPPLSFPSSSSDVEPELGDFVGILDGDLSITQTMETSAKITSRATVSVEGKSPFSADSSGEEEEFPGFALPESSNIVQPEQETLPENIPVAALTDGFEIKDASAMEEEIKYLRNLVQSLRERERCLEMHLLEYHGLKEQEAFISELQNRLKINATETKLLSVKIETLKTENEKLRSEASDYARVAAELETQRKHAALLKSRLESIGERAKEKIAALHTSITELREMEKKELEGAAEMETKLKRLNEAEHELMELRKESSRLLQDRSELMQKMASGFMLNSSVPRSPDSVLKDVESGWSMEEPNPLREENEKLKKEMEQLRADRCVDVEELVYLRWLDACLRYELRNHMPAQGRTLARDLSRSLSPGSEQKVKRLILEYSDSGFDPDHTSSSTFYLEDPSSDASSEGTNEASLSSRSTKSSRERFLGKLKKLVLGKAGSEGNPERSLPSSTTTRLSKASVGIHNVGRLRLEERRGAMVARCKSDLGEVFRRRRLISVDGCLSGSTCGDGDMEEYDAPEKVKLKKFAQVLESSHGHVKLKRRPASLSFA